MKQTQKKNQTAKEAAKILLTLIGAGTMMSAAVIIMGIASDKPKYDKFAHAEAKHAYNNACVAYAITYTDAAREARKTTYTADANQPLMLEIATTEFAIKKCNDDFQYGTLAARYDSLNDELDNRISDEMSAHAGLNAATHEMADARATLEKYEQDRAVRAQWARQPLAQRVDAGLKKIFSNKQQLAARKQRNNGK